MRWIAALTATVVVVVGVLYLRDATMSTHAGRTSDSQIVLIVEAEVHGSEPGQSLAEYTRAKILFCLTEVRYADPVGRLEPVNGHDGRFRIAFQPSLDDTDRKQLRGCLEDWNVDHLQLDVVSMEDIEEVGGDRRG